MSATLGPIHNWLYTKINLQNNLSNTLIEKYGLNIKKIVLPTLEDAIDGSNIHGWLQEKIDIIEIQFAKVIKESLNTVSLDELNDTFTKVGTTYIDEKQTAMQFYKSITDKLLDGMPCDHVNSIIESEDNYLTYKKNICVHQKYWDKADADINVYHALINSLIKGMSLNANINFSETEQNIFKITEI